MTKLLIQIPCHNEAQTLPAMLADLPHRIDGVDVVEWLVVDDGSTDGTAAVAREHGVHHIVTHRCKRGLAHAFRTGLDACLRRGADIIVNTDGDNQYCGRDIAALIAPILRGEADVVIGDRHTAENAHFSGSKKLLQRLGSFTVRKLSGTSVPDAVSGFRAFTREAALNINIVSSFSYTIETIIQAGRKRMAVRSVPVRTNAPMRESRLFRTVPEFICKSLITMVRVYTMYHPLRIFFGLSLVLTVIGAIPIVRFLFFYFTGDGSGHIQSLVLGGVFVLMGFITLMIGVVADLVSFNRQLLEMMLEKVRDVECDSRSEDDVGSDPTRRRSSELVH